MPWCAGPAGAPVVWLFLKDSHYQAVVMRQHTVLMAVDPASKLSDPDSHAEFYLMLPNGALTCGDMHWALTWR